MAVTISMLNKKGGVGKTSTTFFLGGCLARGGRRTLLIDNDPQASLTLGILGADAGAALPREDTIAALFDDALIPDPERLVLPTPFENLFLCPGSDHLSGYNLPDAQAAGPYQYTLAEFVNGLSDRFDVILVDNPPNLLLCARASLVASDYVIVPLQAEDYGAQGIGSVQDAVAAVQAGPNPRLKLLGYLVTMYQKRLSVHMAYADRLRANYGGEVFTNVIPQAAHYKEAVIMRTPVSHYKPRAEAAKAVQRVADEMFVRIAGLTGCEGRAA